jgi:hypothetical protein
MQGLELAALIVGVVLAVAAVVLIIKAVLWTGMDARRRGFRPVWLLQLLVVLEFPWPFLVYYVVARNLDRARVCVRESG